MCGECGLLLKQEGLIGELRWVLKNLWMLVGVSGIYKHEGRLG